MITLYFSIYSIIIMQMMVDNYRLLIMPVDQGFITSGLRAPVGKQCL